MIKALPWIFWHHLVTEKEKKNRKIAVPQSSLKVGKLNRLLHCYVVRTVKETFIVRALYLQNIVIRRFRCWCSVWITTILCQAMASSESRKTFLWLPQEKNIKRSRQKSKPVQVFTTTWFVQLQTNNLWGLFKDFLRKNYSFQGLRFTQ